MEGKKKTLDELLGSMLTLNEDIKEGERSLPNNAETWSRIGSGDSFSELGFKDDNEKEAFLKEWTKNNEYSNL